MSKRRWNNVNEFLDILFSNNIEELAELAELADVELGGDHAELEEDIAESGSDEYDDDDYDPIDNLHGSPKAEDVYAEDVEICVPNAIATFKLTQPEPKTTTTNLLPDNFDMDPYMDTIPDIHNIVVHTDHNDHNVDFLVRNDDNKNINTSSELVNSCDKNIHTDSVVVNIFDGDWDTVAPIEIIDDDTQEVPGFSEKTTNDISSPDNTDTDEDPEADNLIRKWNTIKRARYRGDAHIRSRDGRGGRVPAGRVPAGRVPAGRVRAGCVRAGRPRGRGCNRNVGDRQSVNDINYTSDIVCNWVTVKHRHETENSNENVIDLKEFPFLEEEGLRVRMNDDSTVLDFVQLYLTDEFFMLLVTETNRFAQQFCTSAEYVARNYVGKCLK